MFASFLYYYSGYVFLYVQLDYFTCYVLHILYIWTLISIQLISQTRVEELKAEFITKKNQIDSLVAKTSGMKRKKDELQESISVVFSLFQIFFLILDLF